MTATLSRQTARTTKEPFVVFAETISANYARMSQLELYEVGLDTELWDTYLAAFPAGTNNVFRTQTSHDCRYCRSFVKGLGHVVNVVNNHIITVWDGCDHLAEPYATVARQLAAAVKSKLITKAFYSQEPSYGRLPNTDAHNPQITWTHFYGVVASKHRTHTHLNDSHESLSKGLAEFTTEILTQVIDVIETCNGIYRGQEFLDKLKAYLKLAEGYATTDRKDLFVWENAGSKVARLRSEVIGTLLSDLAKGVDLDQAIRSFGSKMAPGTYKHPTSIATPKMIDAALKTLRDEDLESAIERRHARLSDLSVADVLWVNNDASVKMQDPLRALLLSETKKATQVKTTSTLTIKQLLELRPSKLELLLKTEHLSRFVSLTAAVHPEVNPLFKWNNHFGWSYDGNTTDSLTQRVSKAGGNTAAALRCSLGWYNYDDLDIHCNGPEGHVYYNNKLGILDVDMNVSKPVRDAVENLSWSKPKDGEYTISVQNFNRRESIDVGFELELALPDGRVLSYTYARGLNQQQKVIVLSWVVLNGQVTNLKTYPGVVAGEEKVTDKWGVKTNTPVPVDTILLSPNHWENSNKEGNLHWFFILKDCLNPDPTRGIYNEFLRSSLEKHRKVFEILASKTKCPYSDRQLSGVGFSATQKASVQVLADSRPYEIQFS
jgi:hypothetical protein